jgi:ribosomal protein L16
MLKKNKKTSGKRKLLLNISKKLKFTKPRKSLTNVNFNIIRFKRTRVMLGQYAVQATKAGILTRNQLESVRIYFKKSIKHLSGSRIFVLVKPDRIVTKRSQETRMGKGKGSPKTQVALVTKGQILYEIICKLYKPVIEAFNKSNTKLPVSVKLIKV